MRPPTLCRPLASVALLFAIHVPSAFAAPRSIRVFVALADNTYQGIVPVPRQLGNGDDPDRNLYWGSAYGVRTFFTHSADWKLISRQSHPAPAILERCVFRSRTHDVYLIADAYRGREIEKAIVDFFEAAAGSNASATISFSDPTDGRDLKIPSARGADMVAYVGHDGLMDFRLTRPLENHNRSARSAIILACASRNYFSEALRAHPARIRCCGRRT